MIHIVTSGFAEFQVTRDMNPMITFRRRLRHVVPGLAAVLMLAVAGSLLSVAVATAAIPPLEIQDFVARSLDASDHDYTVAGGHPEAAENSFSFPSVGGGVLPW